MTPSTHWNAVYGKPPEELSWTAAHLDTSLHYVQRAAPRRTEAVIDVGGGDSTFVDDLLHAGYIDLTVLDLSEQALRRARNRVGLLSGYVAWRARDILDEDLPASTYDVWHDRAVFHFLTRSDEQQRYLEQVRRALKPGGYAVVGTFGPLGPAQCSGLEVSRYAPEELHGSFGEPFRLLDSRVESHITPWGTDQQFVYCFCRFDLNKTTQRNTP
jgi:SAM-dependent methyltransferase